MTGWCCGGVPTREREQMWVEFDEVMRLRLYALTNSGIDSMKNEKSPGMNKMFVKVWKNSKMIRYELFCFLQKIWRKE